MDLISIFEDHHNFFDIDILFCITILTSSILLDYFSTMQLILLGGQELNFLMKPFIDHPFTAGLIKIIELMILICMIKLAYDIMQHKVQTKYNRFVAYISFLLPSIITFIIAIHNLMVIF